MHNIGDRLYQAEAEMLDGSTLVVFPLTSVFSKQEVWEKAERLLQNMEGVDTGTLKVYEFKMVGEYTQ